jgi:hypothetical protein
VSVELETANPAADRPVPAGSVVAGGQPFR